MKTLWLQFMHCSCINLISWNEGTALGGLCPFQMDAKQTTVLSCSLRISETCLPLILSCYQITMCSCYANIIGKAIKKQQCYNEYLGRSRTQLSMKWMKLALFFSQECKILANKKELEWWEDWCGKVVWNRMQALKKYKHFFSPKSMNFFSPYCHWGPLFVSITNSLINVNGNGCYFNCLGGMLMSIRLFTCVE